MIKGLTETLAGRVGLVNVYPLSASEIAGYKKIISGYDVFIYACLRGTYPAPAVDKSISMPEWYSSYLGTYIERDAKNLYNIGNLNSFDTCIRILAARPGQMLNYSSLSSDVKVSVNTIKNWVSILQASGIIHLLYPYHANVRTQLVKTPKVYFADTGLVARLNRVDSASDVMDGNVTGMLFENFIVMEVMKKIENTGSQDRLFYFRNSKGVEVDMLIEQKGGLVPVEIKAMSNPGPETALAAQAAGRILKKKFKHGYTACLKDGMEPLTKEMSATGIFDLLGKL
jgi:predicted AAA+ superfamily ATPase